MMGMPLLLLVVLDEHNDMHGAVASSHTIDILVYAYIIYVSTYRKQQHVIKENNHEI